MTNRIIAILALVFFSIFAIAGCASLREILSGSDSAEGSCINDVCTIIFTPPIDEPAQPYSLNLSGPGIDVLAEIPCEIDEPTDVVSCFIANIEPGTKHELRVQITDSISGDFKEVVGTDYWPIKWIQ